MGTVFKQPRELLGAAPRHLGASEWLVIDQERIDAFADATGDRQWIYVDPIKAQQGPFGACIAHSYLVLSLVNLFLPQLMEVQEISMGVNIGCGNIRFPQAVKVGSRIRGRGDLVEAREEKGAIQAVVRVTVEIAGSDQPACVADTISRYFGVVT